MLQRIRGTQDFLDLSLFNFIINTARTHLSSYAFEEIATPLIESTDLFRRSLGLNTDVVTKEMFLIKTHDGDDSLCLRPEATASIMRAFFNNAVQERPWRVFTVGPMFRYERPQKGRYRQFHQLSVELIGASSIAYDAEFIALVDSFISQKLKLNSYALLINFLGSPEDRARYKQALYTFLNQQPNLPQALEERKETNLLRVFDLKDEACKAILEKAPLLIDYLSDESQAEWNLLRSLLDQLSISYVIDPRLVRGLDYYNKTVFEFVSFDLGAQNAFCGGGRYDHLSLALGEKEPVPSIGVGFGIERLMLLLEAQKATLSLPQKNALFMILPFTKAQHALALICAQELRNNGHCVEVTLEDTSIKNMMKQANKRGASYAILIGEDEQKNNQVTLKNMTTGTEEKVVQEDLVTRISHEKRQP